MQRHTETAYNLLIAFVKVVLYFFMKTVVYEFTCCIIQIVRWPMELKYQVVSSSLWTVTHVSV